MTRSIFVVLAFIGLFTSAMLTGCSSTDSNIARDVRATPSVPTYDAKTFFETTSIRSAGINHNGTAALVTSDKSGIPNVYRYPLNGDAPTQLTNSKTESQIAVSWFPNDDRVLITADKGGNEMNHLFVRELDGTLKDISPGNQRAVFLGWSNNGKHFYAASNLRDPRFFDVYRYSSTDYSNSIIYENKDGTQPDLISKDGRWIAMSLSIDNADTDMLIYDTKRKKMHTYGADSVGQLRPMSFSPDSRLLYFSDNTNHEFNQGMRLDLAHKIIQPMPEQEWDVSFYYDSNTAEYSVLGLNEDAQTKVTIERTNSAQQIEIPSLPRGNVTNIYFSRNDRKITFILSSDTSPANLYTFTFGDEAPRRLTNSLSPNIDESHLVESKVVRFSSYDGVEIPNILYKPKMANSSNPVPALILIHGGPGGQSRVGYSALIQHLVNHGYAVMAINNRGSSGYGKAFFHLDDQKHGDADLGDVVSAKKFLQRYNWVQDDKIALIGGSYGGYLTMAGMAFTDEFAAGINIFGVTNWVRTLKSIPPYWESFRKMLYSELGDPATDEERLMRISPLFHADKITKPVLVVQGANDPRVLQIESDEMVAEIEKNGVPVEYVLFEDEGHGFRKKENRIAASNAYVNFLKKYL